LKLQIGSADGSFLRWGDLKYKKAREFGFTHIDFDQSDTVPGLYECSAKEMERKVLLEKKMMDEAGVFVNQVHGPWIWPPKDFTEQDRIGRMDRMKRSIYCTAAMGCKYWVVHPLMPFDWDERVSNPGHEEETWDINREFMYQLLITAKENDVIICFENMPMPNFSIGSPQEILKFVKEMNDDHFQICLDTGHVSVYPAGNPSDAVRLFGNHMKVLHVHDNDGVGDRHWIPYFGVIDWNEFGQALKETGYNGVFSLECSPYKKMPDTIYEKMCRTMYDIAVNIVDK